VGTKTKMSKLKNTFGLPESLISSVKQIHEKKLSRNQEKIAKFSPPEHKINAEDFKKLRNRHNPDLEPETKEKQSFKTESSAEGWKAAKDTSDAKREAQQALRKQTNEQPPASKTPTVIKMGEENHPERIINAIKRRQALGYVPKNDPVQKKLADRLNTHPDIEHIDYSKLQKNSYQYKNELIEAPTYPYKANEIAPLLVMLRTVVNFLSSTPALKKIMREETGIDSDNMYSFVDFLEVLGEELDLAEKKHKYEDEKDEKCSPKKPIK